MRAYENPLYETENYSAYDNFDRDIFYFFVNGQKLFVRYNDGKKQLLCIKDGKVLTKDVFLQMENLIP